MMTFGLSSRANPLWLLWLILGSTAGFVALVIGMFFWMQRPIKFEEKDLYGTWVSGGPPEMRTNLEFEPGGDVVISGAPLPQSPDVDLPPPYGKTTWSFYPGAYPHLSLGAPYSCGINVENGMFSTVLVISTGIGDPDAPEGSIRFTHKAGGPSRAG